MASSTTTPIGSAQSAGDPTPPPAMSTFATANSNLGNVTTIIELDVRENSLLYPAI